MNRYRIFGYLSFLSAAAFAFVGCSPDEAAQAKAVADAAAVSPNPILMAIGTLVSSFIGSHYISKANDVKADAKPYTPDDLHAIADGLSEMGYVITKKPTA